MSTFKLLLCGALALAPCAPLGSGPKADPMAEALALAHQTDLDAGEGRLQGEDLFNQDPHSSLSEQHLWKDRSGRVRKYRVEYGQGDDFLSVDFYYAPDGSLRLMTHSSGRQLPLEDQAGQSAAEELFHQTLLFDAKGSIVRVLYHKAVHGIGTAGEREEAGELKAPDEGYWPVIPVRDPEADFRRNAAALKPARAPRARLAGLDPGALQQLIRSQPRLQLIDVRQPEEYAEGHIAGARLMPLPELPQRLKELDRSRPLALYCRAGRRSAEALKILRSKGFKEAWHLSGGIQAWAAAGHAVEKGAEP